jgi:hypothetical protein
MVSRRLQNLAAAALAALGAPAPALGISEVRVGVVSNDMAFTRKSGLSFPDPFRHRHESGANLTVELTFASPPLLRLVGSPRPRMGASLNTSGYTDDLYADLAWRHDFGAGPFGEAFFGGAWHDGVLRHANPDRSELGSRFLFHVGAEAGWRVRRDQDVSVLWEHLSNGSFSRPNQGLDRLGLRWGVRFD